MLYIASLSTHTLLCFYLPREELLVRSKAFTYLLLYPGWMFKKHQWVNNARPPAVATPIFSSVFSFKLIKMDDTCTHFSIWSIILLSLFIMEAYRPPMSFYGILFILCMIFFLTPIPSSGAEFFFLLWHMEKHYLFGKCLLYVHFPRMGCSKGCPDSSELNVDWWWWWWLGPNRKWLPVLFLLRKLIT